LISTPFIYFATELGSKLSEEYQLSRPTVLAISNGQTPNLGDRATVIVGTVHCNNRFVDY